METKKELKKELSDIKGKLSKLVDFIASEEYYNLSEGERGIINQQRVGMELYQSSLVKRLYGDIEDTKDSSNFIWLSLLFTMFNSPFNGINPTENKEDNKQEK